MKTDRTTIWNERRSDEQVCKRTKSGRAIHVCRRNSRQTACGEYAVETCSAGTTPTCRRCIASVATQTVRADAVEAARAIWMAERERVRNLHERGADAAKAREAELDALCDYERLMRAAAAAS